MDRLTMLEALCKRQLNAGNVTQAKAIRLKILQILRKQSKVGL